MMVQDRLLPSQVGAGVASGVEGGTAGAGHASVGYSTGKGSHHQHWVDVHLQGQCGIESVTISLGAEEACLSMNNTAPNKPCRAHVTICKVTWHVRPMVYSEHQCTLTVAMCCTRPCKHSKAVALRLQCEFQRLYAI